MSSDGEHDGVTQDVSEPYRLVIGQAKTTWYWPGSSEENPRYFVTAKHPGVQEDEVTSAMAPGVEVNVKEETGTMGLAPRRNRGFVEKCVQQITAFRLPIRRLHDGSEKDATLEPNEVYNREVYTAFTYMEPVLIDGKLRDLRAELEAHLDKSAGRNRQTVEDVSDLGEEPGS